MRRGRLAMALGATALLAYLGLHLMIFRALEPAPLPKMPAAVGTTLSAESCAVCHVQTAEEWRDSRMAEARTNPVYEADFEGQGEPFVCERCHAPLVEQQPRRVHGVAWVRPLVPFATANPDYDAGLAEEGVTCVVCHLDDGQMLGTFEPEGAPHPVRVVTAEAMNDRCSRCHQLPEPPLSNLDRPLIDTFAEWGAWRETTGSEETCVSCHMPPVERVVATGGGPRSAHRHTFRGAWDDDMVRASVAVGTPQRDEAGVSITLTNLAGHRVPSGDPGRALVVVAQTDSGDSEVVIARRVPHAGFRDLGDTTLAPGEERLVHLPIADEVGGVDVVVRFERLRFLPALQHAAVETQAVELFRASVP